MMCAPPSHPGARCWIFCKAPTKRALTLPAGTVTPWKCLPRLSRRGDSKMASECTHLNQIRITTTNKHVCEDCVKTGDTWVHLRMCLECGHVGCCDSSKNKHATKHFHATRHPLMRSIEPGEKWMWCYVDEMMTGEVAA